VRFYEANADRFDAAAIREHALPFVRERFRERISAFIDKSYAAFREGGGGC
jgi:hypothetical protein